LHLSHWTIGKFGIRPCRVKIVVDFKFIDIMDERDPYTMLLGIEWDFDNNVVVDLKKETMTFGLDGTKVV
jgi:hypothetical protein